MCFVALCLFVVVTSIRFNRNTALINRPLNDARYFIAYVEHFRGETPSDVIRPASNWRMLVPYVASVLPLKPLTAINITNQILLLLSLVLLYFSMMQLGIDKGYVWLGLMLFTVSFPAFYYTAIGYVDAGVMFFVSAGIYATIKNWWWLLLIAFVTGFLAKESIVVLIPFVTVYAWMHYYKRKAVLIALLLTLLYVAESYLVRQYAYITPGEKNNLFWVINADNISLNLHRVNSLLAPMLTLGIVGLIYLYNIKSTLKINKPLAWASLAMLACCIAMYAFAFITTFADGRPLWLTYYAMIMVSMYTLQHQNRNS
jgi:hypothetical protein